MTRTIFFSATNDGGVLLLSLLFPLAVLVGCGFGARAILLGKGRSGGAGFCLGFFLGLIGVIIAAVLQPSPSFEAERMRQQMMLFSAAGGGFPAGGLAAPQWAPDPFGKFDSRYYDGRSWTEHVTRAGTQLVDLPIPTVPTAPPQMVQPTVNWTPTVPAVASANPAQWSPDPFGRHDLRYFDGRAWTEHISNAGRQSTDPAVQR